MILLAACASSRTAPPGPGAAAPVAAVVTGQEPAGSALDVSVPAEPAAKQDAWRFRALSYLWVPGIEGRAGRGGAVGDVDLSVSDTLDVLTDHLEKGVLAHFAARKGSFGAFGEIVALELEDESSDTVVVGPVRLPDGTVVLPRRRIDLETETTLKMTIAELGATVALTPTGSAAPDSDLVVEALIGARYYDVELDVRLNGERLTGNGEDWVDGLVGARAEIGLDEDRLWTLSLRGDVGGFGIGTSSDLAWRATGLLRFRPWENTRIFAGWHVLDIDAERGSGSSRAVFDVRLSGPVLGVVYEF